VKVIDAKGFSMNPIDNIFPKYQKVYNNLLY